MISCWCGGATFVPFNSDYGRCDRCGTLVYLSAFEPLAAADEVGFYGREYWLDRQAELGHPTIQERVRQDLTGRNLHWLRTMLAYAPPPGRVLEIGCGHGSFLAVLGAAGYEAVGLELSSWVVDFARSTFGALVQQGRVEDQDFEPASFDLIVMMDMLEHLLSPLETLERCLALLKPGGRIVIQTPNDPGLAYEVLVAESHPFQAMLLPVEHVNLFGKRSIEALFSELGVAHLVFEEALFPYDMFLFASRNPLPKNAVDQGAASLERPGAPRIVLGLLDLVLEIDELADRLRESEADRAARLEQIHALTAALRESEADRAARLEQIHELTATLRESEADRAARLEQIHELTITLRESEADRAARLELI